ncbi:MAG: hypothetical protein K8S87_08185 [Planctomycetes bacterium]|nr:hypothetical protein [Planctomycetota bacterium]
MIKGGPFYNADKTKKDTDSKDESAEKLTPEQALRAKRAAATVLQELLKNESKKKTPRILWYVSGCILGVIILIIASFLIPLLSMVGDAKDIVREHLSLIQDAKFDKAYELCDMESFAEEQLTSMIFGASENIKKNGFTDEFKQFAKDVMRKNYSEKKAREFLDVLANDDIYQAVSMCDVEYFAKRKHHEEARKIKAFLDRGSFEVQKFSTVEKPPAVRGQIIYDAGMKKYFTYNVFNNETWKISRFRFGYPRKEKD